MSIITTFLTSTTLSNQMNQFTSSSVAFLQSLDSSAITLTLWFFTFATICTFVLAKELGQLKQARHPFYEDLFEESSTEENEVEMSCISQSQDSKSEDPSTQLKPLLALNQNENNQDHHIPSQNTTSQAQEKKPTYIKEQEQQEEQQEQQEQQEEQQEQQEQEPQQPEEIRTFIKLSKVNTENTREMQNLLKDYRIINPPNQLKLYTRPQFKIDLADQSALEEPRDPLKSLGKLDRKWLALGFQIPKTIKSKDKKDDNEFIKPNIHSHQSTIETCHLHSSENFENTQVLQLDNPRETFINLEPQDDPQVKFQLKARKVTPAKGSPHKSLLQNLRESRVEFKKVEFEPPKLHSTVRKKPIEYYLRWDLSDEELEELNYSEKCRRFYFLRHNNVPSEPITQEKQMSETKIHQQEHHFPIERSSTNESPPNQIMPHPPEGFYQEPDDDKDDIIYQENDTFFSKPPMIKYTPNYEIIPMNNIKSILDCQSQINIPNMQSFLLRLNNKLTQSFLLKTGQNFNFNQLTCNPGLQIPHAINMRKITTSPAFIKEPPKPQSSRFNPIIEIYQEKTTTENHSHTIIPGKSLSKNQLQNILFIILNQ
jgi:hypothetical protein